MWHKKVGPRLRHGACALFLWGCASHVPSGVDINALPKASADATEILYLQSNVMCQFFIDGEPVIKGKRVRVLVTRKGHQIVCKPDEYRSKEDFIQPPFDPSYPIGFTFLLEDQLPGTGSASGSEPARLSGTPGKTAPLVEQAPVEPSNEVDMLPTRNASTNKRGYAVVIGIQSYREKLPRADFADRDATIIGKYLSTVLGYPEENVVVRTNEKASLTDLIKYFENWLPNNLEKDGSVFVYYSGHGAPNTKTGEAYLVPYDGDPTFIESTGYPVKRLYAALEKLPANNITVVLDSCFSGAGGRSVLAKGAKPLVLSVENAMVAGGKAVVLTASAGNQISSAYQEKGHGLLTYYFLKGLQGDGDLNKDGVIDMAELYQYVKPNVQKVARKQYNNEQTPQLLASPEVLLKGGGRLVELARP